MRGLFETIVGMFLVFLLACLVCTAFRQGGHMDETMGSELRRNRERKNGGAG